MKLYCAACFEEIGNCHVDCSDAIAAALAADTARLRAVGVDVVEIPLTVHEITYEGAPQERAAGMLFKPTDR